MGHQFKLIVDWIALFSWLYSGVQVKGAERGPVSLSTTPGSHNSWTVTLEFY